MKINDVVSFLDSVAPPALQESYDNAGLILGDPLAVLNGILISLDVTEEVIREAVQKGLNLVVAHHPLIFGGLKKITGSGPVERAVIAALKEGVAVYASHTNLDAVRNGVNQKMAEKMGLEDARILQPAGGILRKLVCFIPSSHLEEVRQAVFNAGGGHIGNYDQCAFQLKGEGTFRALEGTDPFVGEKGQLHTEPELRWETIYPAYLEGKIIRALLDAHPYEEVAYDIYPLENRWDGAGQGMIGKLSAPVGESKFLNALKETFGIACIRHSPLTGRKLSTVALCGGSGSHLLGTALRQGADVFVSADFKYHQFFDADARILVADIGHYESEQFTKEIFYDLLTKKFPNFAVQFSETNTNPVNYL